MMNYTEVLDGYELNDTHEHVIDQLISDFSDAQLRYRQPRHIALIACYVPLFLLAAAANVLIIIVVFKYHYMRRLVYLNNMLIFKI